MGTDEKLFLGELVFSLVDRKDEGRPYFEKYYLPIKDVSFKGAFQKALIAASRELDERRSYTKEHLSWAFIGLDQLYEIERVSEDLTQQRVPQFPKNIRAFTQAVKNNNEAIQIELTV